LGGVDVSHFLAENLPKLASLHAVAEVFISSLFYVNVKSRFDLCIYSIRILLHELSRVAEDFD
uniref:Protein YIPF n=1 Tax=Parascaris univalens TaxID=6257 RepID=A0A915B989_PARUN